MLRVLPRSAGDRTKVHSPPSVSGLVLVMPAAEVVVKQNDAPRSHARNDAPARDGDGVTGLSVFLLPGTLFLVADM